jgi:hypothetical protein
VSVQNKLQNLARFLPLFAGYCKLKYLNFILPLNPAARFVCPPIPALKGGNGLFT